MDTAEPTPLLRNRDFLLFVSGRTSNTIAVQALTVAVGWHVYQVTGDPVDLGLVGLAQFAPALALFLVSGLASDRFDRKRIQVACNLTHMVVVGLLIAILSHDDGAVWPILAVLVLHGAARSFFHTASQAILPNLVPRPQFPNAIAYSSSASKAAQLIGPALGGLLIAWTGDGVYWVILATFAVSAASVGAIGARLKVQAPEPFGLAMILGGFSYVWRNKLVLGAISIDLMAVLFGGVMGLLPVFASDVLHVGPDGLGVMRAMPAVGSLVIGLALTQIAAPRQMGPAFFVALAIFGASIVVFSLSETFWLSLLALGVYGGADMVSVYIRQTLVQIATPDGMRGRVSAVNSVAINASNELGDFRAGMMAGAIGSVPSVLVGGIVTIGITALWWRLFPGIRRVDRLDDLFEK
ncbi:MFS transporter [Thalassobaculum fulvum]|uniref:MFS transporter n=1 Tax=Thalassobaculum fulvum TaxID=1633335 RepID=A0A918XS59_9PROT|nr:MFS transporter [Thalassobaculum fulvum]GHD48823.1 MFS transporter [Thalassobaculum fulvum]